jgi:hypothetical protein
LCPTDGGSIIRAQPPGATPGRGSEVTSVETAAGIALIVLSLLIIVGIIRTVQANSAR